MTKKLSNIELYNLKQLKANTTTYSQEDILQQADILYKMYETGEWRPFNYKCKHCTSIVKSVEKLIIHLETCKGLDDDYVPKTKRKKLKGFV